MAAPQRECVWDREGKEECGAVQKGVGSRGGERERRRLSARSIARHSQDQERQPGYLATMESPWARLLCSISPVTWTCGGTRNVLHTLAPRAPAGHLRDGCAVVASSYACGRQKMRLDTCDLKYFLRLVLSLMANFRGDGESPTHTPPVLVERPLRDGLT